MSPVMFKDGQILFKSGQIAMDPACCCNSAPPAVCDRCGLYCFSRSLTASFTLAAPSSGKLASIATFPFTPLDCSATLGSSWPFTMEDGYSGSGLTKYSSNVSNPSSIIWRKLTEYQGWYLPTGSGIRPYFTVGKTITLTCSTGRLVIQSAATQYNQPNVIARDWFLVSQVTLACFPGISTPLVTNACGVTSTNVLATFKDSDENNGNIRAGQSTATVTFANNLCCVSGSGCTSSAGNCAGVCGGSPP